MPDVQPELGVQLAHASRGGDVYFRQVVTDHIQSDEQQPAAAQLGRHLLDDPAVPGRQRHAFAAAASGEIATELVALRNACEGPGHGLAVDDQDALVTRTDLRDVFLRDGQLGADAMAVAAEQGFQHRVEIAVTMPDAKDAPPAHAIQRLQHDSPCSAVKRRSSAASRLTSVGAMHCVNCSANNFSLQSRSARGSFTSSDAAALRNLQHHVCRR